MIKRTLNNTTRTHSALEQGREELNLNKEIYIHAQGTVLAVCTVTGLGPKQVKLAFEADPTIKIDREEIYLDKL